MNEPKSTALGGMLVRREAWTLSLRAKILIVVIAGGLLYGACRCLYPFLAITSPVPSDVLVIDGWLSTYDLEKAAREFQRGHYQTVLIVRGAYGFENLDHDPGNARVLCGILARFGIPADRVNAVIFPGVRKDRTFFAAAAVRRWFADRGLPLTSLDLVTAGPHARRSRLVYEKALGEGVRVGVIAVDDPSYDSSRWWRYSEGVREVFFESIAYLYVRLVFSAPA